MPKKSTQSPPPVIAQVISPTTITYVRQAFSHQGYVVTRRSRGIGPPQPVVTSQPDTAEKATYAAYQDYYHPVFNKAALAHSPVQRTEIEEWLKVPGNDAGTHPQYAPLCLRWGENPGGIFVSPYKMPPGNPAQQVGFIPYSQDSGQTIYYLIDPVWNGSPYARQLLADGILQQHADLADAAGAWRAWHSTDWPALQRALAVYSLTPVLTQYVTEYSVSLYTRQDKVKWSKSFYLSSEAEELYDQFPENPAYNAFRTDEYPRLVKAEYSTVHGAEGDFGFSGEKVLFKTPRSS